MTRLYLGKVENVGKTKYKMFLGDSFSVARILILFFFILLVLLASILDICGYVENMSCDPGDNEMSMTEEVAEESVLESQGHLDIESSSDPSMDISSSPEERDHWHWDEKKNSGEQ